MATKVESEDLTPTLCAKLFNDITDRLESGDTRFGKNEEKLNEHQTDITVLKREMSSLTSAIKGQTKAMWGVVTAVAAVGIGFIIWFIQTLPR